VENIFNTVVTTGRTTDGVISIGQPFMFRGGVRLRFWPSTIARRSSEPVRR
jgi:hypothetical protein